MTENFFAHKGNSNTLEKGCMARVTYGAGKGSTVQCVKETLPGYWLVDRGLEEPRFHVYKESALKKLVS